MSTAAPLARSADRRLPMNVLMAGDVTRPAGYRNPVPSVDRDGEGAPGPRPAHPAEERALDSGMPAKWVTADEAYGKDSKFRLGLQRRHVAYVLAVACNQKIPTETGSSRADILAARAPDPGWKRRSCGDGVKGPRLYDWAVASLRTPERLNTVTAAGC